MLRTRWRASSLRYRTVPLPTPDTGTPPYARLSWGRWGRSPCSSRTCSTSRSWRPQRRDQREHEHQRGDGDTQSDHDKDGLALAPAEVAPCDLPHVQARCIPVADLVTHAPRTGMLPRGRGVAMLGRPSQPPHRQGRTHTRCLRGGIETRPRPRRPETTPGRRPGSAAAGPTSAARRRRCARADPRRPAQDAIPTTAATEASARFSSRMMLKTCRRRYPSARKMPISPLLSRTLPSVDVNTIKTPHEHHQPGQHEAEQLELTDQDPPRLERLEHRRDPARSGAPPRAARSTARWGSSAHQADTSMKLTSPDVPTPPRPCPGP